jgi:hypothetical protein
MNHDELTSLDSLLPASYRTEVDRMPRLYTPSLHDATFLEQELSLQRLDSISGLLWLAGRPMPPRPLHYQLILGREISIAERLDMHLVWTTGRMFLKPISPFLLEPSFWTQHLSCPRRWTCLKNIHGDTDADISWVTDALDCRRGLQARALGFLLSYVALISYDSDFHIAREKHLLPKGVDWPAWRILVCQILDITDIDQKINVRFIYGKLRLSRLNKIYLLSKRPFFRGYMTYWQQYGTYFQDNLAWLATTTIYITTVLTAMQDGHATSLAHNDTFQSVSHKFTIFSILAPLIAAAMILLVFCYVFTANWVEAVRFKRKRHRALQARSAGPQ